MDFNTIIKPIALDEAEEAVIYYETELTGLGNRFYNSFLLALNEIQLNPFAFSYIKKPVRRHIIKKYPYKIFYIITQQTIFIIGISHAKRSNAFVKKRLKLV